jgi:hypothetical protein
MANTLSLAKPGFKTAIVESLYNEILSNSNSYYYFLGRTLDWTGISDTAAAPEVTTAYENQTREEIIFLKKITSADAAYIIPRYDWISGSVYDMYDDNVGKQVVVANCLGGSTFVTGTFDMSQIGIGYLVTGTNIAADTRVTSVTPNRVDFDTPTTGNASGTVTFTVAAASGALRLEESKFYAITNERNVYKCLFNNNGAPSTVKPYSTTHETIATADGYIWKFMYTIPSALVNKFMSVDDMPVTTAVKNEYYSRGAISSITIENSGENYVAGDQLVVTGDGHLSENTYQILAVSIEEPGSGYVTPPTVAITNPYDAILFEQNTFYLTNQYVKVDNRIYEVTTGGISGSVDPTHTSSGDPILNGGCALRFVGLTASGAAILTDGSITSVPLSGIVGYVEITNVGSGYDVDNPPAVTITGDGINATATAQVSASGRVTAVVMADRGTDYTTATVEIDPPASINNVFDATTSVNLTTNTITITDHGFITGNRVIYTNGSDTSIGGLTSGDTYFVILVDVDHIKLASTYKNAMNFNELDLTSGATGTSHTIDLDVEQATANAVVYYGFGYSTTPTVDVTHPFVADHVWTAAGLVDYENIVNYGDRFYQVATVGTDNSLGESPPTHLSGTVANGKVDLLFVGQSAKLSVFTAKTAAKVVPIIENGQIVSVITTDSGIGYTTATINAYGNGTGAILTPNLSHGDLNSRQANIELLATPGTIDVISVLNPGSSYASATITITGDGEGCVAEAVIENGGIAAINVIEPGFGYTKATVTITGNTAAQQAYARAIVSPINGHGSDAVRELFAKDLSLSTTISTDRNLGFVVDNDYRQLGIIKNPRAFGATTRYTNFTGSTCYSITGNFLYALLVADMSMTDESGNRFRLVATPATEPAANTVFTVLVQSLDNATPTIGEKINYGNTYAILSAVTNPTVNKYSGDLLFIDNRSSFQPTDEQTISIKTAIRL